jgi:hypothetical protein
LLSIIQDSLSNGELNFICQFPQMFGIFLLVVVYDKISPAILECPITVSVSEPIIDKLD